MTQEVMIQIFESDFNADGLIQTVNARDLHEALGVNYRFNDWIKEQLQGFKENQDFMIFTDKPVKMGKGRPRRDYALTLDTAKHICMLSRCEKGRQLRQYFIEVEKQYRLGYTAPAPQAANTEQQQIINAAIAAINNIAQVALQAIQSVHVTSLTNQQQHTEPVEIPAPAPQREHFPVPRDMITISEVREKYFNNKDVLMQLIVSFGVRSELHHYGYTPDLNAPMADGLIYDRRQLLAILAALRATSYFIKHGGKFLANPALPDAKFTFKRVPTLRDGITADDITSAVEVLLLMK